MKCDKQRTNIESMCLRSSQYFALLGNDAVALNTEPNKSEYEMSLNQKIKQKKKQLPVVTIPHIYERDHLN